MKGLEVEYPSFKSSFFDARTAPEQLYRSYYERNQVVAKAIALYRDDFHLFQQRRENRQIRRGIQTIMQNARARPLSSAPGQLFLRKRIGRRRKRGPI
jgi:hypothetical protein